MPYTGYIYVTTCQLSPSTQLTRSLRKWHPVGKQRVGRTLNLSYATHCNTLDPGAWRMSHAVAKIWCKLTIPCFGWAITSRWLALSLNLIGWNGQPTLRPSHWVCPNHGVGSRFEGWSWILTMICKENDSNQLQPSMKCFLKALGRKMFHISSCLWSVS